MSLQTWAEVLTEQIADGPALNTSTTPTSLLGAGAGTAKFTLPANYWTPGRIWRVTGFGRLSNIVTTPGTLTLDLRFGSTVVFNGGAMQLSTTAHTNLPIMFQMFLTCRASGGGTTSNLMGQGWAQSQALSLTAVADSTTSPANLLMPNTAPAVGGGFDATVAQVVDLFGTFSISNAANSITLHQFLVESLN